ncbi:MAG: bifunctional metallophosphatase/5'-nucleotidase [Bacteroidales bacterium]|nr:bifunctional metallophosphatase/5'-nucleotidase [Bacteroidales bacterium]
MKQRFRFLLISSLIITLISCQPQEQNIRILVTTDVHGAFFPTDPITGRKQNGSMAHVSTYLENERKAHPNEVIVLDNGDIIQGDPSVYYYNFENTETEHLFTKTMHLLQYDAATVGNHDIETGHDVYDRIRAELNIPWLAANCIDTENGEPYFEPYTIIKRGGITVAILGLITPGVPGWLPENIWSGMEFLDMIETAKHWVPVILEKEKPDILIGLFHSGLDYTYNKQDKNTPGNENAVRLVVQEVAGFDVVFAGHDHLTWNEYQLDPEGDSVLILGSGSKARELAEANFHFKKNGRKWKVIQLTGHNISMKSIEPNPAFSSSFEEEISEVKNYVNQEVAKLLTPLSTRDAFFGPSAFMSLIHRVQLGISGADISFAAPLSYNTWLKPGMLTMNDLFDLYRFENLLYTMSLTGQEILDYLNYSYGNWINQMHSQNDHLIKFKENKDGSLRTATNYYNFDSALGINYLVDIQKEAGQMVTISSMSNGDTFDLNKTYSVAINSYRGNGGGGHLIQGAGIAEDKLSDRIITSTDKDLRFYMKIWMEDQKVIEVKTIKNWSLVPEELASKGRELDYKILFRKR